ncbi:helix-turn-helix domain-containing protein [Acidovorax sp.]|uniref:helix-turn-helix domain-containing protein n=1 Tax=Acidovorax sp. TaxID=1872122 RepID=UPI00391F7032
MPTRKSDPPKAAVGRALQVLRAARDLKQEDLISSVSRRHIGRIEQGHQLPSIGMIEHLAEGLHIHPMTLLAVAYARRFDSASVEKVLKSVRADLSKLLPEDGS